DDILSAFNTPRVAVQRDLTSWLSAEDLVLLSTPLTPVLAGFTDYFESLSICQRPAVPVTILQSPSAYQTLIILWTFIPSPQKFQQSSRATSLRNNLTSEYWDKLG